MSDTGFIDPEVAKIDWACSGLAKHGIDLPTAIRAASSVGIEAKLPTHVLIFRYAQWLESERA